MSTNEGEVRCTPLYDEHVAAGARIVPFAGWSMPVQYSSILAEHNAVRTAAGLFDVSHMGEVEISGPAAEQACSELFTNHVAQLEPGRACYALLVDDDGEVLDDVIVYRLEAERFLVCVNASNQAKDFQWMHSKGCPGASIVDHSDKTALIAMQGPAAAAIAASLAPSLAALERFAVTPVEFPALGGLRVLAARTGYTGEDGFEFFVAAESAVALWRGLLEAGADQGLIPIGLGARDTLRLEAALPLYGHELGEGISPFEVRVGWAVKLDRPEMHGYAALTAAKAAGPARRLLGLLPEGGIAREGAPVFEQGKDEAVGFVTSGTHSPTLGQPIAMALVAAQSVASPLEVEIRKKRRPVVVTSLPFYVRQAP